MAEGRIDKTVPFIFSADETADVGVDDASPVVEEYGEGRKSWSTGRINRVTVEMKWGARGPLGQALTNGGLW